MSDNTPGYYTGYKPASAAPASEDRPGEDSPTPQNAVRKAPMTGDVVTRNHDRCPPAGAALSRNARQLAPRPVMGCGCQLDNKPLSADEIPSEEDVHRFNSATTACPKCDTELRDDALACWSCGHNLREPKPSSIPAWALATSAIAMLSLVLWVIL